MEQLQVVPVAVETKPVHRAAGAERQWVACFVDDPSKGVGSWDSGQAVFGAMAAVDQVSEVPLRERELYKQLFHNSYIYLQDGLKRQRMNLKAGVSAEHSIKKWKSLI